MTKDWNINNNETDKTNEKLEDEKKEEQHYEDEDDYSDYSSWKKNKVSNLIPKYIKNGFILIGGGFLVFILLVVLFKPKTSDLQSPQALQVLEVRIKNIETQLSNIKNTELKPANLEKLEKDYALLTKKVDSLENLISSKLEGLEKKIHSIDLKKDNHIQQTPPQPQKVPVHKPEMTEIKKEDKIIKKASKKSENKNKTSENENKKHQHTSKSKSKFHLVVKGETLFRISHNYGLTVEKLLKINNLPTGASIHPGQKLKVE